jgi:hypothetical protein
VRPDIGGGHVEHRLAGLRAGGGLNHAAPPAQGAQRLATGGQWFHQNSLPSPLLEKPRLAQAGWMIGPHFDEKAGGFALEIVPGQEVLPILSKRSERVHAADSKNSRQSCQSNLSMPRHESEKN